jgi:four helix bundle protein
MVRERSFRGLAAWQRSMDLVVNVYRESAKWSTDERFGLTAQVRRAVVSVPANIAEGSGRSGSAEMRRFLSIAHGSLCEVQTHLEVAQRLGMTEPSAIEELLDDADEVSRIIKGFIRSLGDAREAANSHNSRLTTHD